MSSRPVPAHLLDIFDTLVFAIANRRQVVLRYGGLRREVCPHSLGWKGDHLSCFAYQFGGRSRRPLPKGGQWRCFHLHSMSELAVREGEWHTGPIDPQSSSCVDDFVAYVGFPSGVEEQEWTPLDASIVAALQPIAETMDTLVVQHIGEAIAPLEARIAHLERTIARMEGRMGTIEQ